VLDFVHCRTGSLEILRGIFSKIYKFTAAQAA